MEQLTEKELDFGELGKGHLYKCRYFNGKLAIVVGDSGRIGKLSVNLEGIPELFDDLGDNEFYVKLYGIGDYINKICFNTGLFKIIGNSFRYYYGIYQKWSLIT